MKITGIILAGGGSTRMKRDKAMLSWGSVTLLEVVAREMARVCAERIIVSGEREYRVEGCTCVPDSLPGMGPLGGIYTGLAHSGTDYNLVAACDIPYLRHELLELLVKHAPGYQVVVPLVKGYYEPLIAFYHKECLPVIANTLKEGQRKITAIYPHLRVKTIDEGLTKGLMEEKNIFFNLNTPKDWQEYCKTMTEDRRKGR